MGEMQAGQASTVAEAAEWIERRITDETQYGLSMWAVEKLDGGQLIGLCGLFPHEGNEEIELGYIVGKAWWGWGVATEAAQAVVRSMSEAGYTVYATIRPWNVASMRVAERVGLAREAESEDDRGKLLVFRARP